MVYVTHYGDYRRSCYHVGFSVCAEVNALFRLFLIYLGNGNVYAELHAQQHCCFLIEVLVDVCHDTHLHERHDNFRAGLFNLF